MKKILLILIIAASIVSCEKEDNLFDGTEWVRSTSTGSYELMFNKRSFSIMSLNQYGEIISNNTGDYSISNSVAFMVFKSSMLSDHEAEITGSSLVVTNLSTNKTFRYVRK